MTDAELLFAIQGGLEIGQSKLEFSLALLTGYLLIAHFIGEKLTRFEVCFVNAVYILVGTAQILSVFATGQILGNLRSILVSQTPELSAQTGLTAVVSEYNYSGAPSALISMIVLAESLLFMQGVRKRKTQ